MYHSRFESEFRWDFTEDTYDDAADKQIPSAIGWGPSPRREADEPDGRAARRAVRLLEEKKDVPFFIGVGFLKPHDPWVVPEAYIRMYPPPEVTLPPEAPNHGDDAIQEPRRGAPFEIPREKRREARAAYQAAVTFVDAQLGLLLDALDRLRLWDRTVVVVLGDNGVHVGEHGIFGKMTLFEESARVPLLLAAPAWSGRARPRSGWWSSSTSTPRFSSCAGCPPWKGWRGRASFPSSGIPTTRGKAPPTRSGKWGPPRRASWPEACGPNAIGTPSGRTERPSSTTIRQTPRSSTTWRKTPAAE